MNRCKIRVLFIIPSLSVAGAETQVIDLVNSLDDATFDTYLFAFHKNVDQKYRLDLQKSTFYNKPRKHRCDFSAANSIARLIDREKIDVVHCTLLFSVLIGWLSIRLSRNKPRLVAAIHTTTTRSLRTAIFEKLVYQWLLRGCHHVIFVCKKQAAYWTRKYPFLSKRSTVIYNGVDTSYFNPIQFRSQGGQLRQALSIPKDATVVCCIAGFRKEKAHGDLIEAFAHLKGDSYLLLAGEGERKRQIEFLVRKKALETRVRFLGKVKDVRPVLAASNLSVIASTEVETFSIAMLESMSTGIPVVSTDIGGLSEAVIPGKTGKLVSPANPRMLGRALEGMLASPEKCKAMGMKCREIVLERFTKQQMVLATERLLSRTK